MTKLEMLQECKDYLETQMNRSDSVVASNKIFRDIKILPDEDTLLSWVWRGQLWRIEAKGEITMPLIQVEIKIPESRTWNKMWLSHVQHLTVVMGLITSWYKEQLKEKEKNE